MLVKHIGLFLICCWVSVVGISSMLAYKLFHPVITPIQDQVFTCGNASTDRWDDSTFADGKAIFYNNCASCHNPLKDATGPALGDIGSFRSREWMCKFLTNSKFIPNDKRATNFRKQYGLSCMKFPMLNCHDIEALMAYTDRRH